jgi:hypothetical protein
MSDTSAFGFGQFVPGFDFLQNLAKSAGGPAAGTGSVPGMSSWVAPTLSVEELDKRIQELKAVHFWLEQNGTALKATIQALEVQKMTLTTLQGMNVNMAELAKAFTARAPTAPASTAPAPSAAEKSTAHMERRAAPEAQAAVAAAAKAKRAGKAGAKTSAAGPAVDPMQWWGSLTQQFQNIAASAMQDVAAQSMKTQAASAPSSRAKAPPAAKKTAGKNTRAAAAPKARPSRP